MIVSRAQPQEEKTSSCLHEIGTVLRQSERGGGVEHERVVEVLTDYGQFEAAVADILSTDANAVHPTVTILRQASLLAGHLFCSSWEGAGDHAGAWAVHLIEALERIAALPLPQTLPIRDTNGTDLVCEAARHRWPRHRKYLVSFEGLWIRSGRLGAVPARGGLSSSGAWLGRRLSRDDVYSR